MKRHPIALLAVMVCFVPMAPGREGTCWPIAIAPAPTLSGIGEVIGFVVLLLVIRARLRRRQVH